MSDQESPLLIRRATIEDAERLASMLAFIENKEVTGLAAIRRLCDVQSFETTYLAVEKEQAAGFACLRLVPAFSSGQPYAEISELYVEDRTRRKAIGRKFLAHLEQIAAQQGAGQLHTQTGLANMEAKIFFRGMGYRDYALSLRKRL